MSLQLSHGSTGVAQRWGSSSNEMVDDSSSGTPHGKGYGSFGPSSGASQPSQDLFYPKDDGSEYLPQSDAFDLQAPPQSVSEPYPATFIVQTAGGYKHTRRSGTKDRYSLDQKPYEYFSLDWSDDLMPSSTRG